MESLGLIVIHLGRQPGIVGVVIGNGRLIATLNYLRNTIEITWGFLGGGRFDGKPVGIRKPGAFKILILIKKSNGRTFAVQMGIQEECSVESTIGGQGHGKSRAHGLPVRIIRGELKWHSLDRSKNPPHCNVESG